MDLQFINMSQTSLSKLDRNWTISNKHINPNKVSVNALTDTTDWETDQGNSNIPSPLWMGYKIHPFLNIYFLAMSISQDTKFQNLSQ